MLPEDGAGAGVLGVDLYVITELFKGIAERRDLGWSPGAFRQKSRLLQPFCCYGFVKSLIFVAPKNGVLVKCFRGVWLMTDEVLFARLTFATETAI